MKYCERAEWADITPIPQDDGPDPPCSISYTPLFVDAMDYFRAVMKQSEMSERAFSLTTDILSYNPANYTAWQYRRDLIKALNKDLNEELLYTSNMGSSNVKNYQIWHHRRFLIQELKDESKELAYCKELLEDDSKNYHAWTHRQWVLQEFGLWDKELSFVNDLLDDDVRNNSAWNHRHFIITSTTGYNDEVVEREVKYTLDKISLAPSNESPWNYLCGAVLKGKLSSDPSVKKFAEELFERGVRSPYLAATLAKLYEEEFVSGISESCTKAIVMYDRLATDFDCLRTVYWQHRKAVLEARQ
eukprot:CFRG2041T1